MSETTAKERVEQEISELNQKLNKIEHFFTSDQWEQIGPVQQELIQTQHHIMILCLNILETRIKFWDM